MEYSVADENGASKGNPSISSYGFCLRDSIGNLVYAEAKNIGVTTNMDAEVTAIWKAIKYCNKNGFQQIKLETDSLVLKNILRGVWKIPWELAEKIEEILALFSASNIQIDHIFRESNQLADYIANTTIQQEGKQKYSTFTQLPIMARRILNIDKHQVPSLRIRTRRITNYNIQAHDS